jgi:hypothetical protein
MRESDGMDWGQQSNTGTPVAPHPRAVGSPLPRGSARHTAATQGQQNRQLASPPPGRPLATSQEEPAQGASGSGVDRIVTALRSAVPFVQRLLPLLDGNIASAVANVLTSHPPKAAPPVSVNLAPLEETLTELQIQHRELHDQVVEQNTSLKRVEDQLEMVREATDRNTLEQQELMEDLKAVGTKVNIVALVALALLGISLFLNLILYLHIERVLP